MRHHSWAWILFVLLAAAAAAADSAPDCLGLEVEAVETGSQAEEFGFRSGDVLKSWRFVDPADAGDLPASGGVCTFFDFWYFNVELLFRGDVEIAGLRDGETVAWRFDDGPRFGIPMRQVLDPEAAALWQTAEPLRNESADEADAAWQAVFDAFEARSDRRLLAWALVERGYGSMKNAPEAAAANLERAHELLARDHPWEAAHVLRSHSLAAQGSDMERAHELMHSARSMWLENGYGLSVAHADEHLGIQDNRRQRLSEALGHFGDSRDLRSRLAADSAEHATALHNYGTVLAMMGRIGDAIPPIEEAWSILKPMRSHRQQVSTVGALATLYGMVGEVEKQVAASDEGLALIDGLDYPAGTEARMLINATPAYVVQGELARAEELARRSLGPAEASGEATLLAQAHHGVAWISELRGDLDAAARSYERALEIHRTTEDGVVDEALTRLSLGVVRERLGDSDAALEHFAAAERMLAEKAPEHLFRVALHGSWARLLVARGDAAAALERADRALELAGNGGIVDEHPQVARAARVDALLALSRDDEALAEAQAALEDARRSAPGAVREVQSLELVGRVERSRGHWQAAADAFCAGADLLERQIERLGGVADSATRFRSVHHGVFEGCAEALLMLGRTGDAFAVVERARAWKTRRALAERSLLVPGGDAAPRLRQLAAEHDETLSALASAADEEEAVGLRKRLQVLAFEREEMVARLRETDPKLARLAYPEPLGTLEAAGALAPGEVLLSYLAVGGESSIGSGGLLVLRLDASGSVEGRRLDLDPAKLAREVEAFVDAIEAKRPLSEVEPRAQSLWDALLAPILVSSTGGDEPPRRLLLSADGPLHRLPWSALGRRTERGWRWLIEDMATVEIPSATVLAELSQRPAATGGRVAAFGEVVPRGDSDGDANEERLRSLVRWSGPLPDLPGSGAEVENLRRLYGDDADVYLGPEATETRVRGLAGQAISPRIVHFAGHALVDESRPLESGLVLSSPEPSAPGADNGFLQAWEIVQDLRLDAELVTLSACSTARGTELRGEGVLGLPRAFLHAGARSVLATLWPVADRSTARFMDAFYRKLRDGARRDEALRSAQLELLGHSGAADEEEERGVGGLVPAPEPVERPPKVDAASAAHPFYWAAFRLVGAPG